MSTDTDPSTDASVGGRDRSDWTDAQREAYRVMTDARPGDYVLFAGRKQAMEVVDLRRSPDGNVLVVDKPRSEGTYEVRERYDGGRPKYTSGIGRATDLRFVERAPEPRGISDEQFQALVNRLTENAIDAFVRLDYGDWSDAVADVVSDWAERVSYREWAGYRHHPDWEDGDPEAIYESVVEHGLGDGRPVMPEGDDLTIHEQAEVVLYNRVYSEGRDAAEAAIITSDDEYGDVVDKLAHHSLDRFDRKDYPDARVAVRDTISQWVDDRESPALQSVIQYGEDRFDDADYAEVEDVERERAYDILDHEVWESAREYQRDRGEHDPTIRGLTYADYRDLVDHLALETARRYDSGLLRTAAKQQVSAWADDVEAHEWDGHRHRVFAAGDVEDIFSSVAIHSEADPTVFNPFSRNKERKLAVAALVPAVTKAAENILDEGGEAMAEYDADEYLETLGVTDLSYEALHAADDEEVEQFLSRAVDSVDDEVVGWTFVEEIVEAGGTVVESTNDWTLVDYGVVRTDESVRKLAWFDRETGALLILSGQADEQMGDLPIWDDETTFHVQRVGFGADEPEHLLTDVPLAEALDFTYDYLDADQADLRVIEDGEDIRVQDGITDDDINAPGMFDALVPNSQLGVEDIATLGGAAGQSVSGFFRRYWTEISSLAALGALVTGHWYVGGALVGTNLKPSVHKRKGVGVKGSKQFGSSKGSSGVGGEFETELYVRNKTFSNLAREHAPRFIEAGFQEGDLLKGPLISLNEGIDTLTAGKEVYDDPVVEEITAEGDLRNTSEERVRDLARRAERDFESEDAWDDIDDLRKKVYGYAKFAEPDTVSWGGAFLDEYGGSIQRLREVFERGGKDALADEEALSEQTAGAVGDIDPAIAEQMGYDPGEYDPDDFSWADLRRTETGISGILLRGLEAEDVVAGAEFLNIDRWLDKTWGRGVQKGSEYVERAAPDFEEWQDKRFGPGKPGGPEEEARRMARYHKEVAAAEEPPDPADVLGLSETVHGEIRDEPDDLGDYNLSQFADEHGTAFEEVAEKFRSDEPVEGDHEVADGHE